MAAAATFVDENRSQDAQLEASENDEGCYPIYLPAAQVVPVKAVVSHLLLEVSRLRCEVAMAQAQLSYLAAMVPNYAWPVPQHLAARSPPGDVRAATGAERPFAAIELRKISNKKVARRPAVTSTTATTTAASSIVKALNLEPANGLSVEKLCLRPTGRSPAPRGGPATCDGDFARRLVEERAVAYEEGTGPDDSGSTATESSDGDACILCDKPASYTCFSGCGSFCEMCFAAHEDDGRHWAP